MGAAKTTDQMAKTLSALLTRIGEKNVVFLSVGKVRMGSGIS